MLLRCRQRSIGSDDTHSHYSPPSLVGITLRVDQLDKSEEELLAQQLPAHRNDILYTGSRFQQRQQALVDGNQQGLCAL